MKTLTIGLACLTLLCLTQVTQGAPKGRSGRGKRMSSGVSLVSIKQRNSVHPSNPDGTIIVKAKFAGPRAAARVGALASRLSKGYVRGSRHIGVIARTRTKRNGQVTLTLTARPEVSQSVLGDLDAFVDEVSKP